MITEERKKELERMTDKKVFGEIISKALAETEGVPEELQEVAQAIIKEQEREESPEKEQNS